MNTKEIKKILGGTDLWNDYKNPHKNPENHSCSPKLEDPRFTVFVKKLKESFVKTK